MKVAVLGMGYVGCVSAAVLAHEGHDVVGVDVDAGKVGLLAHGESPVFEPGLAELVRDTHTAGRFAATDDLPLALAGAEVILICVGTPSTSSGSLDIAHVERVAGDIGATISRCAPYPVVTLRSTVLPEAVERVIVPVLERASGGPVGERFGFVVNPEFLREGQSIRDFYEPEFTLVGTDEARSVAVLRGLYGFLAAPFVVTDRRTAGLVKYASNAFHAVKVAFANEIAAISEAAGADPDGVMRTVCLDRKLNLSPAYLRPGGPFGGSCLPKDLRALVHYARRLDLPATLLSGVLESNRLHVEECARRILASGARHVGVCGLAFKAGTDDVRESPAVTIVEALRGHGVKIAIYDRGISLAKLVGANREYLVRHVPDISQLLRPSLAEVVAGANVIVLGNDEPEYDRVGALLRPEQILLDLRGHAAIR